MDASQLAIQYVEPFVLMLARFGGLCLFAPVLSTAVVPTRAKVLLVFMFAVSAFPAVAVGTPLPPAADIGMLGVSVLMEALVGVIIGLLAMLPMYATQLGGLIIDHQIGLGLGAVYNPMLDTEGTILGDLLMYIALAAFLTVGGLDAMYVGVVRTFEHLPLGSANLIASPLPTLVSLITAGFELAIRIAAPVMCMIAIEMVCSTFVMKTMPQLNIMSIGFPIKVLLGILALILAVRSMGATIAEFTNEGVEAMLRWTETLRTP